MNSPPLRNSPSALLLQAQAPIAELLSASDDIKRIGITHTNRIPTGEYGEWLACKLLDLKPAASKVSTGGDGTDVAGRSYEVKTRITKSADDVPAVQGKNVGAFDFLVAVSLGPSYEFQKLWIAGAEILSWNEKSFHFGPDQASRSRTIARWDLSSDKLSLVESTDSYMHQYKDRLCDLIELGAVRTEKTLAADLGEFYAACYFDIELEENVNEPGHDALDAAGLRYQIKTRMPTPAGPAGTFQDCFTTYTSFDFKKKVIETKEFDYLIACFLDSKLKPIGFLSAPYETVVRHILDRAAATGKKPSPRFRWNWRRFREGLEPGVQIHLTKGHQHHGEGIPQTLPIEPLPF